MVADRVISVEAFARETPDVPADRITCRKCGEEYIGDPADGALCPDCRRDAGCWPPWEAEDGGRDA